MPTPGRNEPCTCGSGRKFKKCCAPRLDLAAEAVKLDMDLTSRLLELALEEGFADDVREVLAGLSQDPDDIQAADFQFAAPLALFVSTFEDRTVVERLEEPPGRLGDWLRSQREAWLSVWEVVRAVPGTGLEVRDALTGEERFVYDRLASANVEPGLSVLARVVDFGGIAVLGGLYPVMLPPVAAQEVLEEFRRQWLEGAPKARREDLQDEDAAWGLVESWREAATRASRPPTLVNFDGDPVQLVRDTCPVDSVGEVRLRLQRLEGDAREEEGHWVTVLSRLPQNPESGRREPVMWGRIVLGPDTLALETNSLRRADDLRTLAEGLGLGPFSRELLPWSMEPPSGPRAPVPPELAELVRRKKEESYAGWCDEPLPALGGRTASEEVRSPAGRERVEALLREMEIFERRVPEAERFDFDRLRARLGLLGPPKQ